MTTEAACKREGQSNLGHTGECMYRARRTADRLLENEGLRLPDLIFQEKPESQRLERIQLMCVHARSPAHTYTQRGASETANELPRPTGCQRSAPLYSANLGSQVLP